MSAEKIEANYEGLQQVSSKFMEQANQVEAMTRIIGNHLDSLQGGGWIGEAASKFFDEMNNEILPAVNRLNQALENAGQTTRQISDRLEQAEEEASAGFH
jgi:WXG100 family type VII secretion target